MKSTKKVKRLTLNKQTVAGLNMNHMNRLMGGTELNESDGKPRCCNLAGLGDDDPTLAGRKTFNNASDCQMIACHN